MPDLPSDLAKQDAQKLAKAERAIELLQQDHMTLNKKYASSHKLCANADGSVRVLDNCELGCTVHAGMVEW